MRPLMGVKAMAQVLGHDREQLLRGQASALLHGLLFQPFDEFCSVDHDANPVGNRLQKVQILAPRRTRERWIPLTALPDAASSTSKTRSDLRLHTQPWLLQPHKYFGVLVGVACEERSTW